MSVVSFAINFALFFAMSFANAATDKSPLDYPVRDWLWMLGFTLAAGFVSWIRKVRRGEAKPHDLMFLIGELSTAVFAGLIIWILCKAASVPEHITIVLVALSGHMGGKSIELLEAWGERNLRKFLNVPETPRRRSTDTKPGDENDSKH